MAVYENHLTVTGSPFTLRRFDRVIGKIMAHAEAQYQIPQNREETKFPRHFKRQTKERRFRCYTFMTSFIAAAFVRGLSRRFPSLSFRLCFDINRDIWDEGFDRYGYEQFGDFTLIDGQSACGYFTFDSVKRYPVWDDEPDWMDCGTRGNQNTASQLKSREVYPC